MGIFSAFGQGMSSALGTMANDLQNAFTGVRIQTGGQGTSGTSNSSSTEQSNNMSRSIGSGWSESSAEAQANSVEDSYGYSTGDSYGYTEGGGQSTTYGREASAADIQRAKEANDLQRKMWVEQANYNASEAQKARDYETWMSNTAYQRAVADMIKAGINPILAAQLGGASTPSGVAATSGLATAQKATTYAQSESSNWSRGENTSHSQSENNGHGESHSSSTSRSRSEERQEAYSEGYSQGQSHSESVTSNNFKDYINSMNNLLNGGGSAKHSTSRRKK